MSADRTCPDCGAAIPPGSKDGLCSQCLLSLGLDAQDPTATAGQPPDLGPLLAMSAAATSVKFYSFGNYELMGEIARGGMGVVFKARQMTLNRLVALKFINTATLPTEERVKRFKAEAEAAASLSHPNIVPIYEIGENQGRSYFSMKLVEGRNLASALRGLHTDSKAADRQVLSTPSDNPSNEYSACGAARLVATVSRAVHYAHQRGILHRDLKPENILLDHHGEPHVTDFGLAKVMKEDSSLTYSGMILGTPSYMSPEQAVGRIRELTTASDVWSLGVILYELLTGRPPFRAATPMETLRQVLEQEPEKPSAINPKIDGDLETITLRCLQKEPGLRYASAAALAEDLERWIRHEPILARRSGVFERSAKWARRQPVLAAAVVMLNVVFVLGFGGVLWQWHRADEANRESTHSNTQLRRALNQMDSIQLQRAEEYFNEERRLDALPRWALVLRNNPSNRIAAERLFSTLSHRTWARLACPPMEHSNRVTFAAFSTDSKFVVTSSADNTAWVWDAKTGRRLAGPLAHNAEINTVVFSPDGQLVATASQDKTARIWDAKTGAPISEPLIYPSDVSTVQFSPNSKLLLATGGNVAQLWNARTGQRQGSALIADGDVVDARFSPDGSRFALACKGRQAEVWGVASGHCERRFLHGSSVFAIAFSPDGRWLSTASGDKTARVWDVGSGEPVCPAFEHQARVVGTEFSPDGGRIVTSSHDGTAQIWDVRTGRRIGSPLKHDNFVASAKFSLEGQRVVTASSDKTVRVWDALTGKPLTEPLVQEASAFYAEFDGSGQRLLTASNGKAVLIWDTTPVVPVTFEADSKAVWCAQFSPDSRKVAVGTGQARVWDMLTATPLTIRWQDAGPSAGVNDLAFSPDGQSVALATDFVSFGIFDALSGRIITLFPNAHGRQIIHVSFSHDGRQLLSASLDNTARVWSVLTGKPITPPLAHGTCILTAEFSPDDKWVLTTSSNSPARLWNARTGRMLQEFRHSAQVNTAHFSPDGKRVLTASSDMTARIWDSQTGTLLGTLPHIAEVYSARFSPNGQLIVTAHRGYAHTLRVWDAFSFQPLTEPFGEGHDPEFDASSERLLDGFVYKGSDIQIWQARTGLRLSEPLVPGHSCLFSHFSSDNRLILLGNANKTVDIREVAPVSLPVPTWVAELAEGFAGERFIGDGMLESVHASELWAVQQKMVVWLVAAENNKSSLPKPNASRDDQTVSREFYTRWIKWFLANGSTRTVLPSSSLTMANYAQALMLEEKPKGCRQALLIQPTNGVALALLGKNETNTLLADWMTRRAVELDPNAFQTWSCRVPVLDKQGRFDEAINAMEHAIRLYNDSSLYWLAYGDLLERANRVDDAIAAFGKAIAFVHTNKVDEVDWGKEALRHRLRLYERLGRNAEARADWLRAYVRPRPMEAGSQLIDLSPYYNNHFESRGMEFPTLPRGIQTLSNIQFDVRAGVHLWPESITKEVAIEVDQRCRALHFLHGCGPAVPDGTPVANYVVSFANGQTAEVPMVYGEDVRDWVERADPKTNLARATIAWAEPMLHGLGRVRLFESTWTNPHPEWSLKSIHFVLRATNCAPFLVAITAEP